jgi:hypothetical protein
MKWLKRNGKTMKDSSGKQVKVGDYIVYAALLSRSAVLKFGKIVKINPIKPPKDSWETEKPETISALSVTHVTSWPNETGIDISFEPQLKLVTLSFDCRFLVVNPETSVNIEAVNLLEAMWEDYYKNGKWSIKYLEARKYAQQVKQNNA